MRVIFISALFFLACISAGNAQDASIVAMEYYLDTDPGVGNGTDIVFTQGSVVVANFVIPAASLTPGFHHLVVRVQDDNGIWSTQTQRSLFVQDMAVLDPASSITAMEYFIDNDPGVGNGTAIPVTSGPVVNLDIAIPTAALTPGFHRISVRTRDDDGHWSTAANSMFMVHASKDIESVEYFIDTDPGVGSATPVTITQSSTLDHTTTLPASSLPEGAHTLGVRVKREDDLWSTTYTAPFAVCTPPVPSFVADVVCVGAVTTFTDNSTNASGGTYSWDFDGDGTIDDMTAGSTTHTFSAAGTFNATLTVERFGCSEAFNTTVTVTEVPVANAGPDQGLCSSATTLAGSAPAAGESGVWTIVTGAGTIVDPADPVSAVTGISGTLTLEWTVTNAIGGCSASDQVTVIAGPAPEANFTADLVCEGSTTSFTDNSTNSTGASYSWDFDGDGTADDTTPGDASFVFPSAGSYTASLTVDRGGCLDTYTDVVTVVTIPSANAGADQDICESETTLAGNGPSSGESGMWSLVSGSAVIADPGDPATALTAISSYNTVLEWTITHDAGGCSTTDQLTIVSNQPIAAGLVTTSVAIGESVNGDVQDAATTNPGDVLVTTIVTPPVNGSAEVESNGTISYIPDAGATGMDVMTYQVCNQCGRCATNTFEVEIINNPPVITPPPVTVAAGESVDLDLLAIISDVNDNLDPSSLNVAAQPISGAIASIDPSYHLIVDYNGVFFSGMDQLTIEACDFSGSCSDNVILIEVDLPADPPVYVYNALSPNGDGRHDFLELENIEAYPDNSVYIVNRWGVRVFEASGYDNAIVRFEGRVSGSANELPAGTYYYSIDLGKGGDRINGFVVLKR